MLAMASSKTQVPQLVAIGHVDVERGRARVQRLRQAAHGQRVDALLADDGQRGVDDRLAAEGGLGRTVAATAGRRLGAHVTILPLDTNDVRYVQCSSRTVFVPFRSSIHHGSPPRVRHHSRRPHRPRPRDRRGSPARLPLALGRPRHRAHRRDHGSPRQHRHHHRRADRPPRARRRHHRHAMVGRGLHARLRRVHDRRRSPGRRLRPSPHLRHRHRRLHAVLDRVRPGAVARRAHRHPRAAGRLRRPAHPAGARHDQDGLPAQGDGRRLRRLRPDHGPRRHRRADPRRMARLRRSARHGLAHDLPRQRAARSRRPAGRAALHARVEVAHAGQARPARRGPHQRRVAGPHLPAGPGPRARLAGLDLRPDGCGDRAARRLRRRRAPVRRARADRAQPAAQPCLHLGPGRRHRVLRGLRRPAAGRLAVPAARAALHPGARGPDLHPDVARRRDHGRSLLRADATLRAQGAAGRPADRRRRRSRGWRSP